MRVILAILLGIALLWVLADVISFSAILAAGSEQAASNAASYRLRVQTRCANLNRATFVDTPNAPRCYLHDGREVVVE